MIKGWNMILVLAALLALAGCQPAGPVVVPPPPAVTAAPSLTATPTPAPTAAPTADLTPAPTPASTAAAVDLPYYILVDKAAQIVTVYTLDETGHYTLVVRQMLCSTGYTRQRTPEGLYPLKAERYEVRWLVDNTVGRYAVRITGSFLFHSVPYINRGKDTMYGDKYNDLGTMASRGCVRLALMDALWIYEHCPAGTPVELIWGFQNPVLWHRLKGDPVGFAFGWDPTDPEGPDYIAPEPTAETTRCPWVTPAPLTRTFSPEMEKFNYDTPAPSPSATAVAEKASPAPTAAPAEGD